MSIQKFGFKQMYEDHVLLSILFIRIKWKSSNQDIKTHR